MISKNQPYLLGLVIFLSLCAVSFTYVDGQINLNLENYPLIIIALIVLSILLSLLYVGIDKRKIATLSQQIKNQTIENNSKIDSLHSELTTRQKEVYKLIVAGKSNKEIMAELFIEQSTLKTHINMIYKKLNIKSRKELKSKLTS